jgi:hypothetical protein
VRVDSCPRSQEAQTEREGRGWESGSPDPHPVLLRAGHLASKAHLAADSTQPCCLPPNPRLPPSQRRGCIYSRLGAEQALNREAWLFGASAWSGVGTERPAWPPVTCHYPDTPGPLELWAVQGSLGRLRLGGWSLETSPSKQFQRETPSPMDPEELLKH